MHLDFIGHSQKSHKNKFGQWKQRGPYIYVCGQNDIGLGALILKSIWSKIFKTMKIALNSCC